MSVNYKKEIRKIQKSVRSLKQEANLLRKGFSNAILILGAVVALGLALQLIKDNKVAAYIGLAFVLIGAFGVIILYLAERSHGTLTFTTYHMELENGESFEIQYIGRRKKRIRVAVRGKFIEYCRGYCEETDSLYRPDIPWNWYESADFTNAYTDKKNKRHFRGTRTTDEKIQSANLSTDNGILSYCELDGVRLYYTQVNSFTERISIPVALYNAVAATGAELPTDGTISVVGK